VISFSNSFSSFSGHIQGGKKSGEIQNLDNIAGITEKQVKDPNRNKNTYDETVEPFVGKFD
jgi:hypothetical protein